jgi:two-component system, chemotaxis family, chemotaxis protein CheY
MHVLVIDDDARLRQVLTRLLRSGGFDTVDEAADGEEALKTLLSIHPDLILTDCQMPRLDGISFVRRLRARGDQTPVIMLSGQGDPHVVVTAVKAGVNNYLPKPIHPDVLFEKIGQTLGAARGLAS